MSLASRARAGARLAWSRLARSGVSLLLAAAAASIAYLCASMLLGDVEAVFAPIAALITVGLGAGQRLRRAVEIAAGVTVGLLAADLLGRLVGFGALQLALAVLVSMAVAVMVNGGTLMANQAAVAAVVAIVLSSVLPGGPLLRLADALIGGAVAIVLSVLFAPSPTRPARRAAGSALAAVGDAIAVCGEALRAGDQELLEAASRDLERASAALGELTAELEAARERRRLGRGRGRGSEALAAAVQLRARLPVMLATAQGLIRGCRNAVRHGTEADDRMLRALDALRETVALLTEWVHGAGAEPAVSRALAAAGVLAEPGPSPQAFVVLRGHVRSFIVDVLRACGFTQADATRMLDEATPPDR